MRLLLIIIWFLATSVLIQPRGVGVFGVCVSFQASGNVCTYIAYLRNGGAVSMRRTLLEDEFVKYASGYWPSPYNPTKENLFKTNNIPCLVIFDSTRWKDYPLCSPMDSLWKLRFRAHPFTKNGEKGWSNAEFRPSPNQEKYLFKEYGIRSLDRDYFVDTNLWKILRDVQDENWITLYRNIP